MFIFGFSLFFPNLFGANKHGVYVGESLTVIKPVTGEYRELSHDIYRYPQLQPTFARARWKRSGFMVYVLRDETIMQNDSLRKLAETAKTNYANYVDEYLLGDIPIYPDVTGEELVRQRNYITEQTSFIAVNFYKNKHLVITPSYSTIYPNALLA